MSKVSKTDMLIALAMSARPVAEEAPKIRDCGTIADLIFAAMRKSDQFFSKSEKWSMAAINDGVRVRDYKYTAQLSQLPGTAKFVKRYGDLEIVLTSVDGNSAGAYNPVSNKMVLSLKKGAITPDTVNLVPVMTTEQGTLVHELRHWADAMTNTYNFAKIRIERGGIPQDFVTYYSSEHEVDARLADLMVKIDRGLLNVAVQVMGGKKVPLLNTFSDALRSPANFLQFVITSDIGFRKTSKHMEALSKPNMTPASYEDACDKIRELWKLFYNEYGMAFRVIPKAEVTKQQLNAWKSLKEVVAGNRTVSEHLASDREDVLTPKLVKVLGPAAKPEARKKSAAKLKEKTAELTKPKTAPSKKGSVTKTAKPATKKAPTSKQAAKKSAAPVTTKTVKTAKTAKTVKTAKPGIIINNNGKRSR